MNVRIIEPRLVKMFKVVFKLFPPNLVHDDDENDDDTMYECYADVRHVKDSIYVVEFECDEPLTTYYIETNNKNNIDTNVIKRLAEDICRDWDECEEIIEIREV